MSIPILSLDFEHKPELPFIACFFIVMDDETQSRI